MLRTVYYQNFIFFFVEKQHNTCEHTQMSRHACSKNAGLKGAIAADLFRMSDINTSRTAKRLYRPNRTKQSSRRAHLLPAACVSMYESAVVIRILFRAGIATMWLVLMLAMQQPHLYSVLQKRISLATNVQRAVKTSKEEGNTDKEIKADSKKHRQSLVLLQVAVIALAALTIATAITMCVAVIHVNNNIRRHRSSLLYY